jgi:5-formyltetrahydrofolate cyclo-ligase
MNKSEARAKSKQHIASLSPDQHREKSKQIQFNLEKMIREIRGLRGKAKSPASQLNSYIRICGFRSDRWEPDLDPFYFSGRDADLEFYFPKVLSDTEIVFCKPDGWSIGAFGIREPKGSTILDPAGADLVLVPGLGFGSNGTRLGRGKGYYDRALQYVPKVKLVGISFDFCANLPISSASHDIRVEKLITDLKIYEFLD